VFDLAAASFSAILALAAVPSKPMFSAILGLASARFVATGLYEATGAHALAVVAGAIGLALVPAALYGGAALLIEDVRQRTVLPVFRRGPARRSIEGGLWEQLARLGREAGVRQQL